ncbi:alpha/beta fold hydrolase [Jatrophihabitans sp.]|uniref:alpha/beta fold hydrolase n=1 Tax=Jatrophihabitans sp. TaxID=1932789 RepID=UPI002C8CD6B2|nr:alpha/beta fold hydrolase [Jatrophihabitans sp.]
MRAWPGRGAPAGSWQLRHDSIGGRPVRLLVAGTPTDLPEVVMLPGLGAPGYLAPWARRVAGWTRVTVLDLPGWRWGRARACPPTVAGVGAAVADWLAAGDRRGVVLLGHSTGAQAVSVTALRVPDRLAGLVLAGPTFDPAARGALRLVRRGASTFARERWAEIPAVLPSYLHSGGYGVLGFLRDAMHDRPEERAGQLRLPVLVLTGEWDGFAPPAWAHRLAGLASGRCTVLPGAHNACFPYPAAADAALRDAVRDWAAPAA